MSGRFAYVADKSVVELFSNSTKRDREELLRIFERLAQAPAQPGGYVQRSASGRANHQWARSYRWGSYGGLRSGNETFGAIRTLRGVGFPVESPARPRVDSGS